MSNLPKFTQVTACVGSPTPEDWFPEEFGTKAYIKYNYSYTPEGLRARSVCLNCDAYQECYDYALQFDNLQGIWAAHDRYERAEIQRNLNMTNLQSVYVSDLTLDYRAWNRRDTSNE
jgi:hypothetical protein